MSRLFACTLLVAVCGVSARVAAQLPTEEHAATLYSAEIGQQCSEPSLLSLTRNETYGILETRKGGADIAFGQLRVGAHDPPDNYRWLTIGHRAGDDRSVIRDLG